MNNPAESQSQINRPGALYQKKRLWVDRSASVFVNLGGYSVIIAIMLIFVYLLSEVLPLFGSASHHVVAEYAVPGPAAETLALGLDEKGEVGVRYDNNAVATYFKTVDGSTLSRIDLPIPDGQTVTALGAGYPNTRVYGYGLSNGEVLVFKQAFAVSYPNDVRTVTPHIAYPVGEDVIPMTEGSPIQKLALQIGEDSTTLVAWAGGPHLLLSRFVKEESLFDDEVSLEREDLTLTLPIAKVDYLLLDKNQRRLYVANREGDLLAYNIGFFDNASLIEKTRLVAEGVKLADLQFLTGDISLMVANSKGIVSQWFPVADEDYVFKLKKIRTFNHQFGSALKLMPEFNRKVFFVADQEGRLGIYHTTAERKVFLEKIFDSNLQQMAISPRASALLVQDEANQLHYLQIENEHPEVSWSALWQKVWYESYPEPDYVWQSSSADNDFEPKFSLAPLAFGTLKASFYALLMAVPLAIFGAVYTAYFMSPGLRRVVKPSIEIMEALPTVILGFLAGLWLAPVVEEYLAGIFSMLLIVPVGTLVFSFLYQKMRMARGKVAMDGWQAAVLLPVVTGLVWLSIVLNQPIQDLFFDGDIHVWLTAVGIDFDQRNSIVVGLAMGFAVIPTIFSITEDAIFGVPKHLTTGSLALGATPWQTLVKVVLLTASPGIFSAVMIGFGRAVGETMIVLMATGNTPIMDMSLFQGFRTLSANIAVEMPEAEVSSTHFRVLFLAALVLFAFTFFFNTIADVVRQRLRKRYSSL